MKRPSLLDPTFKYTPAAETDLHALFRRVRRQMREAEAAKKPNPKVTAIAPKKAKP